MRIPFTKMQGAGNDFVVLDETRAPLGLRAEHYRFLANRHFGVGADQILTVGPAPAPDVDFAYRIHNADGGEVEHCGNGARCFVRFVREQGLTDKRSIRVQVQRGIITLHERPDGLVTVDMGAPVFEPAALPFVPHNLAQRQQGAAPLWSAPLAGLGGQCGPHGQGAQGAAMPQHVEFAVASMGNPHAVVLVDDTATAPVQTLGMALQALPAFPASVNVGFMQVLNRRHIRLRVYERGAGETLACGTGACAAVVCGIRMGLLDSAVQVDARGGTLQIEWKGDNAPVCLSGPAVTVFRGEIELPDPLPVVPE